MKLGGPSQNTGRRLPSFFAFQGALKTLKSGRGGARTGAGAKKGSKWASTLKKAEIRQLACEVITVELEDMLRAQIAKAKGISFLVTRDEATGKFVPVTCRMLKTLDPKDVIEVWEKAPDTQAFNTLADRAMDRALQPIDLKDERKAPQAMTTPEIMSELEALIAKEKAKA